VTINGGINCASTCILTITGTGKLIANAGLTNNAGIGGDQYQTAGTIKIKGGEISATGGSESYGSGAGIGSGYNVADGGTIEISGGNITATGGPYGAGIGGGYDGAGGNITISGNAIIESAQGGGGGAGIGSGFDGAGGHITILGGTISAVADGGGAGIGGGAQGTLGADGGEITISGDDTIIKAQGSSYAAGIGGGYLGDGGNIDISGGEISAEAGIGADSGAGIGGGYGGSGGEINISGGIISADGKAGGAGIGGGKKYSIYGGNGGTVKISGGTISAEGGTTGGAGIGVGNGGTGGTTQITGGSINATSNVAAINPDPTSDSDGQIPIYLNILTAPVEFDESLVTVYYNSLFQESNYGINDVYTDAEGILYFYLPATSTDELVALSFDEIESTDRYYGVKYEHLANNTNEQDLEYLKFPIPVVAIDYTKEILTGLNYSDDDVDYDISIAGELESESFSLKPFSTIQPNGEGEVPIDESWMDNSIEIFLTTSSILYEDSDTQSIEIPARLSVTDPLIALVTSAPASEGGDGKVSGLKSGMAYSTDPNAAPDEWISVDSEDDIVLLPGTYYFREAATGDTFATEAIEVVIPEYQAPVAPDSPDSPSSDSPDSSAAPLGLAGTGLNLDLAYLLMVLLLAFGTVLRKQESISVKMDSRENGNLTKPINDRQDFLP
jgi:hypothetical protein